MHKLPRLQTNVPLSIVGLNKEERALMVKSLILERLPEDNYILLKYLAQFLAKVNLLLLLFYPP